jgi:hypothetical protein
VGFLETSVPTRMDQPASLGSEALVRRVIDDTTRTVRRFPLEEALTLRPLAYCALSALFVIALVAMIGWGAPGWYRIGLTRYAVPLGSAAWPRRIEIQPLQQDTKVALGGSLLVRMRVTRGMDDDLRGLVCVRDAAGQLSTFAMQREGSADFYCTLEAIPGDLAYWFEAGDADTTRTSCRVTVVTPPAVAAATVRVVAPAYAQPRAAEELDLASGEVRAVTGSTLTLSVRSSQPPGLDDRAQPTARLEFDEAPPVPLDFADREPTHLTASFELRRSDVFRIVLRDADGFENAFRRDYRLIAAPDEPPTVTVMEPSALTEVTPAGSVTLIARAEDDFGIRLFHLTGELANRPASINQVLADHPAVTPAGARRAAELRYVWELAPWKLQAGDVLDYRVTITDNYAGPEAEGQSTPSSPLRLKVISVAELENRLRDEFALLEVRVRQTRFDQEAMRDELHTLVEAIDAASNALGDASLPSSSRGLGPALDTKCQGPARSLARRQTQLAEQLRRVAERFERVAERVRLNHAFDEPTRQQTAGVPRQLNHTASGSMTQAARALERFAESQSSPAPAELAQAAQAAALDELQRVLRWLGQWGDFQGVVAKARDLLDRQQQVRAAALRQGREAVGKPLGNLTDEERTQLRRIVREQEQLAREMDQWLTNGRSLTERVHGKDPASAEALDGALRAAVAHGVHSRMEKAAAALADNRTAAAALDQRAAEYGLAKVLAALEARQLRELAELRKSAERMLDAVAELLRRQEALLAATEETTRADSTTDAWSGLADEQRTVRRNARQLGAELSAAPPTAKASAELNHAVPPMERAEEKLRATAGQEAVPDQREAVAALQAALAELQLLVAQTDHQIMQKTLAQTRRQLEELRDRQEEVNGASVELVDNTKTQGQLTRAVTRRASRLAEQQDSLRAETVIVRHELEDTAVYAWVLDRVSEKMVAAREALAARRLDAALLENQRGVVTELTQLIDALAAIETLPSPDKFAEGESGGGGGQGPSPHQPSVPPVAELIVIKTMQQALNAQTAALQTARTGAEATEEDLRQARAVGRDQEQLRVLTERVTRQARTGDSR